MRLVEYQKSSKKRGSKTLLVKTPCSLVRPVPSPHLIFSPADASNSLSYLILAMCGGGGTDSIIIIHSRILPPRACSCLSHVRVSTGPPPFLIYSLFLLFYPILFSILPALLFPRSSRVVVVVTMVQ
ncbi:uncharacterized protein BDW43DRAFT_22839 [Aspergillus alliaceus]|uniref:uncharacterized protein n=1 Tax=Petromyces alliaceus TaxID=209559 RepID=UPI0012A41D63|nr:uncharacterized protein BDW43DRAFT_22839 [Aspergillus alliaceus]KAB8227012.1 hypothetical protein BDW43DRAFT_22839 [Aspergillus alliaceus]